jgi:hypothetical protein
MKEEIKKLIRYIETNLTPLVIGFAVGLYSGVMAYITKELFAYYLILYSDK